MYNSGRQPSPLDVAFDRAVDFYFSNFSSHEIYWPTLAVKWRVHILGLTKMARTCPIITYETEEAAKAKADYSLRAFVVIPELKLVLTGKGLDNGVSILLFNVALLSRNSAYLNIRH